MGCNSSSAADVPVAGDAGALKSDDAIAWTPEPVQGSCHSARAREVAASTGCPEPFPKEACGLRSAAACPASPACPDVTLAVAVHPTRREANGSSSSSKPRVRVPVQDKGEFTSGRSRDCAVTNSISSGSRSPVDAATGESCNPPGAVSRTSSSEPPVTSGALKSAGPGSTAQCDQAGSSPDRCRSPGEFSGSTRCSRGADARLAGSNFEAALAMFERLNDDEDTESELEQGEQNPMLERPTSSPSRCSAKHMTARTEHEFVDIPTTARIMILQWAKWGRNSLRYREEQRFKELQHRRYPRSRPPRSRSSSPQISPQPSPRDMASSIAAMSAAPLASTWSAAQLRPGTGPQAVAGRRAPCRGAEGKPSSLFEDLADDQRTSMNAQGVKCKLQKNLADGGARRTGKSETPGFGIETPNFAEIASGKSSTEASAMASVMSSNVTSPTHGVLSPWILEAEALIEGEDVAVEAERLLGSPLSAWGISPAAAFAGNGRVLDLPEPTATSTAAAAPPGAARAAEAAAPPSGDACDSEILCPLEEEDELAKVDLFVNVAAPFAEDRQELAAGAGLPAVQRAMSEENMSIEGGVSSKATAKVGAKKAARQRGGICEYSVGEPVKYWSSSKITWLPAIIVERKSSTVYVIDKQMVGCFSKVKTTELISQAEKRHDPFLRAMDMLEEAASDGDEQHLKSRGAELPSRRAPACSRAGEPTRGQESTGSTAVPRRAPPQPRSRSASPRRANSKGSASSAAAERALAVFAGSGGSEDEDDEEENEDLLDLRRPSRQSSLTPQRMGRVVRDDFSSSSDSDGSGAASHHSGVLALASRARPQARAPHAATVGSRQALTSRQQRPPHATSPAALAATAKAPEQPKGRASGGGGGGHGSKAGSSGTRTISGPCHPVHRAGRAGACHGQLQSSASLSGSPRRGQVVRHDISSDSD